jgi:hypothetical protein
MLTELAPETDHGLLLWRWTGGRRQEQSHAQFIRSGRLDLDSVPRHEARETFHARIEYVSSSFASHVHFLFAMLEKALDDLLVGDRKSDRKVGMRRVAGITRILHRNMQCLGNQANTPSAETIMQCCLKSICVRSDHSPRILVPVLRSTKTGNC